MITPVVRVVDIYPYRVTSAGSVEFLLCRRSSHQKYAGQWRMIGGKIGENEPAWEAALRELFEETQLVPDLFWTIPSLNMLYQWHRDRVNLIPGFAAEVSEDPVLNHEHDRFNWWPVQDAVDQLSWPEQSRLLQVAHDLLQKGLPAETVIPAAELRRVTDSFTVPQAA